MLIKGFLGTSLIDFPGHVASLAFVGGCNFRCPFCHNRDLVRGFLKLPTLSEESVLDDLAKRKGFIDGVEVTGGEPCLYADLPAFLRRVKSLGYPVKLDTNGYFPKALSSLLEEGLVDYVAMDVKTSPEKYAQTVGKVIDLSRIGRSIRMILDRAPDYEFRTTVVPTLVGAEEVVSIGRWIEGAKSYALQAFRPVNTLDPQYSKILPPKRRELEAMALRVRPYVKEVILRSE